MKIETFEVMERAEAACHEQAEEFAKLADTLGLAGQKRFVAGGETSERTTIPYRQMTREEEFCYRELCPTKTPAERYAADPIPLRVLQVLAHARETGLFKKFEVWHNAIAPTPDPVLVGIAQGEQSWQDVEFILARWGSELDEFAVLMKKARAKCAERLRAALGLIVQSAQADLAAVEAFAAGARGFVDDPTYRFAAANRH